MKQVSNVLLVDDNELDQFINTTMLKNSGLVDQITSFNSALDALDYLRENTDSFPEVILLDIKMPEMNGFEFLEQFDKIDSPQKYLCCIFMLSSSHDPLDIKVAEENPYVKKYLSKPLDIEAIDKVISCRL
jgi:CheY-like chemotaxis protein